MRGKNNNGTMGWLLKRNLFLGIAILILTFLLVPFQGMRTVREVAESLRIVTENGFGIENPYYYIQQLNRFYAYFGPVQQEPLTVFFGAVGFGSALILFRHLFSRRQAMMMAELPQDRTKDLLQRTGCFGILAILPTVLCLGLYALLVQTNGLDVFFRPRIFLNGCAAIVMTELYGYTMGVLCASVCGTVWSAVLAGVVFTVSVEVIVAGWTMIAEGYLNSMPTGRLNETLKTFSPAVTLYKGIGDPEKFVWLPGVIAIVLFAALGLWAYRKNRPENVGKTLNLSTLEIPVSAWVTLAGVSGCLYVVGAFTGNERNIWICTVILIAVVWVLLRMLLDQRIRITAKHWAVPVCCAAAIFLGLFCLRSDVIGFVRWLPETDKITAVEYSYGNGPVIRLESGESIDAFMELAAVMRDEAEEKRQERPYRRGLGWEIKADFETKDGKACRVWTQPADKRATRPLWAKIVNGDDYKASQLVPENTNVSVESLIYDFGLPHTEFEETFGFRNEVPRPEDEKAFKEALRKDLANRTMDDLETPNVLQVYLTHFAENGYPDEYRYYTVHTCDVNTLEFMLGEDAQKWIDYAEGGFFDSGDVVAFRCQYGPENDRNKPVSWKKAESVEEAKDWYRQIHFSNIDLYAREMDEQTRLMMASRTQMKYYERMGWEHLSEEQIEDLPRWTDLGYASYQMSMAAE